MKKELLQKHLKDHLAKLAATPEKFALQKQIEEAKAKSNELRT